MTKEHEHIARLVIRAKYIRKKIDAGPVPHSLLIELFGIYSALISHHYYSTPQ